MKVINENSDYVGTNMVIGSQTFAVIAYKYKDLDLAKVKKKYDDHFDLKCKVINI